MLLNCPLEGLDAMHSITIFIEPLRLAISQCFGPTLVLPLRAKEEGGFLMSVLQETGVLKSLILVVCVCFVVVEVKR